MPRIQIIDLLRTLAILGMITYHAAYDQAVFFHATINPFSGGWVLLARATAILFLLVSGMSGIIAMERSGPHVWQRSFRRFARTGAAALLVSTATYLFHPETYVRFGILHCIAVSALLLPLVRPLGRWNALVGTALLAAGTVVRGTVMDTPVLLPFGITYPGFRSMDYFPLLPWSGFVLMGSAVGMHLLPYWREHPRKDHSVTLTALAWPGRHALVIYLLHQPVLLVVLWLFHEG